MRTYNNNYKPRRQWKERPVKEGGLEVIVRDNNLEKALRIFKRKVQKSGLLKENQDASLAMRSIQRRKQRKEKRSSQR